MKKGLNGNGSASVKHNAWHVNTYYNELVVIKPRPSPATASDPTGPASGSAFTSVSLGRTAGSSALASLPGEPVAAPPIPGCNYHGCHQWGEATKTEPRIARKPLRIWGFTDASPKDQRCDCWASMCPTWSWDRVPSLPVNLPPSFPKAAAPFGRVGLASHPDLLGVPGFCSGPSPQPRKWSGFPWLA